MATWADIQRLVSDLQRVQLSQSSKKLSEANCIEVVTKLIQRSLINVVFTRDGHSYVTQKHLKTEVRNECVGLGGRAPLTDIATTLNVDLEHVERCAQELVSENSGFIISGGELFAEEYVTNLQTELRSLLAEHGVHTTSSLCKHWNLSQDLLKSLLLDHLPSDFDGVLDGDTIFTNDYLEAHKNTLRATLSSVTKPVSINMIQARVGLPVTRFWCAFDALSKEDEVPGRLSGSRSSPSCTFIPHVHDHLVRMYVQSMFRQQEYIQKSVLKKLGLSEEVGAKNGQIEQILKQDNENAQISALPSMLISKTLFDQCCSTVKAAVQTLDICDVRNELQVLSIPFEDADLDAIAERSASGENGLYSNGTYVFSDRMLTKVTDRLRDRIDTRAHELMSQIEQERKGSQQQKKVEASGDGFIFFVDNDWGDSKKGGGKKKGGRGGGGGKTSGKSTGPTRDEPSATVVGVPAETLERWIGETELVPDDLLDDVVERIGPQVDDKVRSRLAEIAHSLQNAAAQSQKKSLAQLQQKAQSLYASICMFENASASFPDSLRDELRQFLFRTVGMELANAVLSCASGTENASQLKEKQREETIASLPPVLRDAIGSLYSSLRGDDSDAFHAAVFDVSSPAALSISLKTPDSKTRAEVQESYTAELREQVVAQSEPAAVLLSSVLYLLAKNGKPVTASGKFVAQLVPQLEEMVDQKIYGLLVTCQRLVVQCLKNKTDEVAKDMLTSETESLKQAVLT
ncbi:unnamed protein product [Nippostrongylus brasiliensis]|uniref:E3 UFM1-protein ligase 1 homolog n=1 Tax=Nippostrongylus brasiliensis TaxID=27835 RepID=A0A0N4XXB2_NIPBR|nr:unnamed protein product [Nippostrongylus brasiliensis]